MTSPGRSLEQTIEPADVALVIVRETIQVSRATESRPTVGDDTIPRQGRRLRLIRRRLWWRRDQLVSTSERSR
jgi:hypothetical protein